MGYRVIAKISTFLIHKTAREFLDIYNRSTRGCHSAKFDEDGCAVLMLEHDTEAEAIRARAEMTGRQVCEWCEKYGASLAEGICGPCWDRREAMKRDAEGAAE